MKKLDFEFKIESIKEDVFICVTKEHTFGVDAFLLANFSNPKHKDKICDFGTGCGIIPIYQAIHYEPKIIYGVDVMEKAIMQFQYSLEISKNIKTKIIPLHMDLKNITKKIEKSSLSLVTMNPPYKIIGTGVMSKDSSSKVARHETMVTMDDIAKSASSVLKFGGRLVICQRPERLFDVSESFKKYNIEPKRLRFVKSFKDKTPFLFLLEGKKGAKPFLKIEKDLIIRDSNGFTNEMIDIYKTYKH